MLPKYNDFAGSNQAPINRCTDNNKAFARAYPLVESNIIKKTTEIEVNDYLGSLTRRPSINSIASWDKSSKHSSSKSQSALATFTRVWWSSSPENGIKPLNLKEKAKKWHQMMSKCVVQKYVVPGHVMTIFRRHHLPEYNAQSSPLIDSHLKISWEKPK